MLNISKIRLLLKEQGWSASYLSRAFDKGPTWIADMERGRGLPDETTLRAIAEKLGTTVEYLTDQTDKKEQKNKPAAESDELSKMEKNIVELFRLIPSEKQETVYRMIEAALKSQGLLK